MSGSERVVMAVDPGRMKCGVAVVRLCGGRTEILYRATAPTEALAHYVLEAAQLRVPEVILVGDGTTSAQAVQAISALEVAQVEVVDEKFSTLEARCRYFQDNPPRGWRRFLPLSLQTPANPYDDYVAVVLAERYFAK